MFFSILILILILSLSATTTTTECRSVFTEPPQEDILSEIFHPEMVNVQQMAELTMHPESAVTNHNTLMQLFTQANNIVNATGADSVLLEIDNLNNGKIDNKNDSVKLLAVKNFDVPSHEDLLKQFNLYFVNYTELSTSSSKQTNNYFSQPVSYSRPTYWNIFVDFLRNQANAIVGAMMIPISVSSNAIQKSTQTHAEYVMSGSSLGSVLSAPIILKSISIPNIISQQMTDLASHQQNHLESFSEQTKLLTDDGIKFLMNGLNNGTQIVSNVTDQYVIRPIGAFTGFNLNNTGHHITNIAQSFQNTGNNLHSFGEQVNSNAIKLVSAGATAIAWGLDSTVRF